ncbi:MAG: hypothetical protein Q8L86_12310 [Vicinamibacterales bacterium]|nr:hypothetical protein [Vicinamibacterales bacterium]
MEQHPARAGLAWAAVVVAILAAGVPATRAQAPAAPAGNGVFVQDGDTYVALTAWGRTSGQRFALGEGRLEDVPVITDFKGLLVRVPTMTLHSAFVGTAGSFTDRGGESRTLRTFSRRLDARASTVRIADLEKATRVADLLQQVGATDENAGYVFLAIGDAGPDQRGVERGSQPGPELDMMTAGRPGAPARIYLFRLATPPPTR